MVRENVGYVIFVRFTRGSLDATFQFQMSPDVWVSQGSWTPFSGLFDVGLHVLAFNGESPPLDVGFAGDPYACAG